MHITFMCKYVYERMKTYYTFTTQKTETVTIKRVDADDELNIRVYKEQIGRPKKPFQRKSIYKGLM